MYKKNTAITGYCFTLNSNGNAPGTGITTGTTTCYVTIDGVYNSAPTATYDASAHCWKLNLTAAQMNGDLISITVMNTTAQTQTYNIETETKKMVDLVDLSAANVWAYVSRTITDKTGFSLAAGEYTSIATAVWNNGTRTLSTYGTLIADIWTNATRSLTDKAGFSLAAGEYTSIGTAVWANGTRTLSSFGSLAADVWAYTTRTINEKTGFSLSSGEYTSIAAAVWAYGTKTLTSFGTLAADIWAYSTRAITEKTGFSLTAGEYTSIGTAVWANGTRTLSTYGTLITDIWANVTRSLTDKADFGLSTSERSSLATSIWGSATRTLTSASNVASDIWGYVARTITDKTGFELSTTGNTNVANSVWDKPTVGHTTADTFGGNLSTAVSTRLANADYVDPTTEFQKLRYVNNAIYIDTINGVAGASVEDNNGTPEKPVNNLNDAKTLATVLGYRTYELVSGSSIILTSEHSQWLFKSPSLNATIDLGGQNVDYSTFDSIILTGTQGGTHKISCFNCTIGNLLELNIKAMQCDINGNISVRAGSHFFNHCFASVVGAGTPIFSFDSTDETIVGFRLYSGGLEVRDLSANHIFKYDCPVGRLTLHSSCADGLVYIRGLCELTDNSTNITFSNKCDIYTDTIESTVWTDSATRTLTDFGTLVTDIWDSTSRSLTDKVDFYLADGSIIDNTLATSAITKIQYGLPDSTSFAIVDGKIDDIKVVTDKLDTALEVDGPLYRFTENSLENSPVGTGGFTSNDRMALEAVEVYVEDLATMIEPDGRVYRYTANSLENSPVGTGGFTANDRAIIESTYNSINDPVHGLVDIDEEIDIIEEMVTDIKAKTDLLQFSITNDVKATLDSETVTLTDGSIVSAKYANGAINAAVFANDVIPAFQSGLATDTLLETVDGKVDTIQAKTDLLQFSLTNDVKATLDNEQVIPADSSISEAKFASDAISDRVVASTAVTKIQTGLATQDLLQDVDDEVDAIAAVTSQFTFGATGVIATLNGEKVTVSVNEDKTGYSVIEDNIDSVADSVWASADRSLTDKAGFSLSSSGNSSVSTAVWAETNRTLSEITTEQKQDISDTIWGATIRSLTDKTDFVIPSSDIQAMATSVWESATRTLSTLPSEQLQEIADAIWNSAIRSLTDKSDYGVPASDIQATAVSVWESATRTLSSITDDQKQEIANDIWTYVNRTLTDKINFALTSAYDAAKTAAQTGDEMDIVNIPNSTGVTAITNNLLATSEFKKLFAINCGKVIRTAVSGGYQFDFYDVTDTVILHSLKYTDDEREVVV